MRPAPKLLTLLALILCLTGCDEKKHTLVVVVGGLGMSQMGDLRQSLEKDCPRAEVVSAGSWDAYKADIKSLATAKPYKHVVFIGHSFGCQTIAQAAEKLSRIDLAVFIDPAWDDFRLSKTISQHLWFQRSGLGIEREAKIAGAGKPQIIHGDHNAIPHSPELITQVVTAVKGIDDR